MTVDAPARDDVLASISSDRIRQRLLSLQKPEAYDWGSLFPKTDGMGAAADIKRRVRMLASVEPRLDTLLYPGERIEFVTKGMLNSWAEQYFMGIWSMLINQTLFLFTNYRVIQISADSKGRAKTMMWQIPYARMQKYGAGTFSGSVSFKLGNGGALRFSGVPHKDRKQLKSLVAGKLDLAGQGQLEFPSHADRDPLCCRCATPISRKTRSCAECGDEFINPIVPAIMSLIVPGVGDFYLGHRVMGVFELLGFAVVLLFAVGIVITDGLAALPIALIVVVIANAFDGAMTLHIARKGVLAKRLAWRGND